MFFALLSLTEIQIFKIEYMICLYEGCAYIMKIIINHEHHRIWVELLDSFFLTQLIQADNNFTYFAFHETLTLSCILVEINFSWGFEVVRCDTLRCAHSTVIAGLLSKSFHLPLVESRQTYSIFLISSELCVASERTPFMNQGTNSDENDMIISFI